MKITIIGTGYVGLVTGCCLADMGNDVMCLDIDEGKIKKLSQGETPIYEPGLKELLVKNIEESRLFFTTDYRRAIAFSRIIFLCLPTPPKENGDADMSYTYDAIEKTLRFIQDKTIIVTKSTVPVGTSKKISKFIKDRIKKQIFVASNPEFLREGAAVKDFQNPDRIIIGTKSKKAEEILVQLYKPLERVQSPIIVTTPENSELIKYASNSMLATRISFMNELSQLCERTGADIKVIAKGMGLDRRIGPRFLQAGIGYGGSCFPKDVKALAYSMEHRGIKATLLRGVDYINEIQKRKFLPRVIDSIGSIEGKKVAVWGLTFKPKTDDTRESSARAIIDQLTDMNCKISVYDPEGMDNFRKTYKGKVEYGKDMYSILKGAYLLIIITEWDDFRNPDFKKIKSLMKKPVIADGRNIYFLERMKKEGFRYISIGRKTV